MSGGDAPVVHIVEDDESLRDALLFLFRSREVESIGYPSAEAFLAAFTPAMKGCILTDIRMPGLSGLALFDRVIEAGSTMPVVMLTGHGDVPMAVDALKKGAADFVEKPFNDNDLVDRVLATWQRSAQSRIAAELARKVDARLAHLSAREREVLNLLLAGKMNKVIADELGIAMRTVEVHRARIFEKTGVRNAVELARLVRGER